MLKQACKKGNFTKGNWIDKWEYPEEDLQTITVEAPDTNQNICIVLPREKDGSEKDYFEWVENGHLIAAAPFMLDVLYRFCVEESGGIGEMQCQRYEKDETSGMCKYTAGGDSDKCECVVFEAIQRSLGNCGGDDDYFNKEESHNV